MKEPEGKVATVYCMGDLDFMERLTSLGKLYNVHSKISTGVRQHEKLSLETNERD